MAEQTITGVCAEIVQKPGNDWVEFHIDGGGQWPVKLATKKQPLIELGRAVGQQLATWTYNEVESDKINEHTGKPFVNRYLEAVEIGGTVPAASSAPSPQSGPSHPPLIAGDKDRAITRMAVLKAASSTVAMMNVADVPKDDVALEVMKVAQRFEAWVMRDIDETPF